MYLLDTNATIDFLDNSLSPTAMQSLGNIIDEQSNISIVSKMEALGFNFESQEEQNIMEAFINGSNVLDINNEVVNRTIAIRKSKKISLPDAIIAATAINYNLILVTSNKADFTNITGLQVLDPRSL